MGWCGLDSSGSGLKQVAGSCEYVNESFGSMSWLLSFFTSAVQTLRKIQKLMSSRLEVGVCNYPHKQTARETKAKHGQADYL
jgi:hypothetical protein